MRYFLLLPILFFLSSNFNCFGQDSTSLAKLKNENAPISIGIGANISTVGFGSSLNIKVSNKLGFRIHTFKGNFHFNYFRYYQGTGLDVKTDLNFYMIPVFIDFFPFPKSNFRLTGGMALNYNNYKVNVKPANSQSFGYITYEKEYFGGIASNVTFKNKSPYLGIGFDNTVPKHKIGIGLDLGLFFTGKPKFDLDCTGIFTKSDTQENIDLLTDAFKDWSVYPFVNFSIKYRIIP